MLTKDRLSAFLDDCKKYASEVEEKMEKKIQLKDTIKKPKEELEKCATIDESFSNILTLGIQKSKETVNEWEVDALFDQVLGYEDNVAKLQETCLKIQQIYELHSQIGN